MAVITYRSASGSAMKGTSRKYSGSVTLGPHVTKSRREMNGRPQRSRPKSSSHMRHSRAPRPLMYVPSSHGSHTEEPYPGMDDPGGQGGQEDVPVSGAKVPGTQVLQRVLPRKGASSPRGHGSHVGTLSAVAKNPGGQSSHSARPVKTLTVTKVPARHFMVGASTIGWPTCRRPCSYSPTMLSYAKEVALATSSKLSSSPVIRTEKSTAMEPL
mmetsp:Transcript_11831/g.37590  ORF Transcript_11831/g.37590 Transcript_11831/m.37590 type:complete len:213 (-) Transcript_11831:98-736(-)